MKFPTPNPPEAYITFGDKLYRMVLKDTLYSKPNEQGLARRIELDQPVLGLEEVK